jgi:ABC-type antimicrobial peptide transport system ATPase subunit
MSLIVSLLLTYFSFKFVLWLFQFNKEENLSSSIQIVPKSPYNEPLINAAPDFEIKSIPKRPNNKSLDKNFKDLLIIQKPKRKNHISVSVSYK